MDDWVAEELDTTTGALQNLYAAIEAWKQGGDAAPLPDSPADTTLNAILARIDELETSLAAFRDLFPDQ